MRKMKKICMILAAVCILVSLAGIVIRAESGSNNIQVSDGAQILSSEEKQDLKHMVEDLELSVSWDVMVITIDDALGMSAEDYGDAFFDKYTVSDDGVICIIDMDNRELAIRTFGDALYYITDERRDEILDDAVSRAGDGDYYAAFERMIKGVNRSLQRGIPEGLEIYDEDVRKVVGVYREKKRITLTEFLIAVLAALSGGGITIGVIQARYRLKWGGYQYSFRENGRVELTSKRDVFVNQSVTHRHIPKHDSSQHSGRSGGSRTTTHVGAGGRRSGGGSRKF